MLGFCHAKNERVDRGYAARLLNYGLHQVRWRSLGPAACGGGAVKSRQQQCAAGPGGAGASMLLLLGVTPALRLLRCPHHHAPAQVDYALGDCGRSWVVGFGDNWPQARAAALHG